MRIVRFMGYPIRNFSTLERMVLAQAKAARESGHEMEVVFDGITNAASAELAGSFAPDVRIHYTAPWIAGSRNPIDPWRYHRAAKEIIERGRFDIVHAYFAPSSTILNMMAFGRRRPVFVRTIGSTPILRAGDPVLRALKRLKARLIVANMSMLICVAEHIREMLASYGIPERRMVVIPNGADVVRFHRHAERRTDGVFRLTFLGRLDPIKNLETLIDGVGVLVRERGMRDVVLSVYGEGPLREQLEGRVSAMGLSNNVTFVGQAMDVPRVLNELTDVYVQASHNEGCPAAVIEALACEVPVVASRVRGHEQIILDGSNGLLFAKDSPHELADKLTWVRGNPDRVGALTRSGRETVVAHYSVEAWIRSEFDVYRRLLA